jgi:four helix bundle protein
MLNEPDKKRLLQDRTKKFALRVFRLVTCLPRRFHVDIVGKQLLRSGTSVGANYRAACRAKSPADFRAKMAIVEEEADESCYWMEILIEAGIMKPELVQDLLNEA